MLTFLLTDWAEYLFVACEGVFPCNIWKLMQNLRVHVVFLLNNHHQAGQLAWRFLYYPLTSPSPFWKFDHEKQTVYNKVAVELKDNQMFQWHVPTHIPSPWSSFPNANMSLYSSAQSTIFSNSWSRSGTKRFECRVSLCFTPNVLFSPGEPLLEALNLNS